RDLRLRADGVDVRCVQLNRQLDAVEARALRQLFEQVGGPVGTCVIDDLVKGLDPLPGFLWVEVHNPLIQCLMHEYLHYTVPRAPWPALIYPRRVPFAPSPCEPCHWQSARLARRPPAARRQDTPLPP